MPESAWTSFHLRFDGDLWSHDADRLVLDVLEPAFDRCREGGRADAWFFVRYTTGGPHLRFRLRRPAGVPESALDGLFATLPAGALGAEPVAYEPELDRYGGEAGLTVAEDLFHLSSAVAVEALAKLPTGDRAARFGKALLAMLAAVQVFVPSRSQAARFAGNYGRGYLQYKLGDDGAVETLERAFAAGLDRQAESLGRFVEAGWQALESGEGLPPDLLRYRRGVVAAAERLRTLERAGRLGGSATARRWPAVVTALLPSYLHMHNNRLGVRVIEECYLASLVASTLAPEDGRAAVAVRESLEPREVEA